MARGKQSNIVHVYFYYFMWKNQEMVRDKYVIQNQ